MEITIFNDILIIFGTAVVVLFICHRFDIPIVLGYITTGALIGPFALGLISSYKEVKMLSEIGIVLLLFSLGIEFSMKNLLRIGRNTILGGSLQVMSTIFVIFLIFMFLGKPFNESIFLGFLTALSSTAIVLKLLQDKAELETPHGQLSVGILIFQDIVIVLMILVVPFLAGSDENITTALFLFAVKAISIILLTIIGGQWFINRILYYVIKTQSKELLSLVIVVICFSIAWLTYFFGLSLAFGAFLAGLIISNSEYSQQVLSDVLPFRVVFSSFFFISIGMLLNVNYFIDNLVLAISAFSLIILIKIMLVSLSVFLLGYPIRVVIIVGLTICQVGEFSFLLLEIGGDLNLIANDTYQLFLNVAILTMLATPFLIKMSPSVSDAFNRLPIPNFLREGLYGTIAETYVEKTFHLKNHIMIIGFGINGRNVARSAKMKGIPYVIIEMNPDTIHLERKKGELILYGDGTHESILKKAGIKKAKVLVSVISDPAATRRIVSIARTLNKDISIIARTRFVSEMVPLYQLGADEVIPEEFETSIEIFSRVLMQFSVPDREIDQIVDEIRADGYSFYRSIFMKKDQLSDYAKCIPEIEICIYNIGEKSELAKKTVGEIDLRKRYDVDILMIRRGKETILDPNGDVTLKKGDRLILQGSPESVSKISDVFEDDLQ
ncbi:MAG: cation:proton antiporter [Deltaproteobacteria bacterium]|uniref:Cation:proton antiporter n=1 Tax=Candidatus Zymogenus saltonus TaxID=2844893 RepID=A0A9D8KE07_9DELT|nr:cation:proton antiporter [Candidatus Zymogenus saltonus]